MTRRVKITLSQVSYIFYYILFLKQSQEEFAFLFKIRYFRANHTCERVGMRRGRVRLTRTVKKDRRELPKDKKRIITVKTGSYVKVNVSVFSAFSRLKPRILTTKVSITHYLCDLDRGLRQSHPSASRATFPVPRRLDTARAATSQSLPLWGRCRGTRRMR